MQDQIKQSMRSLKMDGMASLYQSLSETHQLTHLTGDQLLQSLLQAEWEYRQARKQDRLVTAARFRYQASLEELDYTASRNLDKNTVASISDCSFIKKAENILITGPTGVGKSFIASAIGHQACRVGYKVMYFNMQKLFQKLRIAKAEGTYIKELLRIEKQDLIILDDFGIHPVDANIRLELLEIIEDRHGKKSTLISSQLPVAKWYELFEDATVADAILDRILHNTIRIDLKGESLRKKR
ncbi:MAG: IS21-like element helper ATPase IstB [Paludibacter sp.]|jgi:DNA replication protein DnaC|nr:IS21-like element helper ATPase IstB [Bacteroidales bacterium]MDX9749425.1 IS21-like element helper ATPase IstB [Paludibacter sp.]